MKAKTYFKKNGFIIGCSSKYWFGNWVYRFEYFTNFDKANEWLNTEEYDFRFRELISVSEAKKRGYDFRKH